MRTDFVRKMSANADQNPAPSTLGGVLEYVKVKNMRHGFIKVAALSPKIKVADPEYNSIQVIEGIKRADENKAKIIVFPELVLTGYTCNDLFLQERLIDEAMSGLEKCVEASKGVDAFIFVGLPYEYNDKLYNVAAVIKNGEIIALIPKKNIPNYGEFYERRYFVPGEEKTVPVEILGFTVPFGMNVLIKVDKVKGLTIGCEICEDLWVPNPPSTVHSINGATVIVNLSASNETVCKADYRRNLVSMTSARLVSAYIYSSASEGESTQDIVFSGHNIIAENGSILKESKRFICEDIYSEIDVNRLAMERRRMSTYDVKVSEDYTIIKSSLKMQDTELTRYFAPMPFVPGDVVKRNERCEEILSIQAYGLKKRLEHTNCKCAVIGISGGLDSTLALLVTAKAFDLAGIDKKGILSVTMPCFGTTKRTKNNADLLSVALNTTPMEIVIKDSVLQHFKDIGQSTEVLDVTFENGQARERTQVLMDLANKNGGMVIGTGDMSELALGWATYNGDHMSMYGVNAGVPKTLVRHLVSYYADTCDDKKLSDVLKDILDTPVSPELLPPKDGEISQKTEELVGPYELHDFFLYYMLRCGYAPEKVYRIARIAFENIYDDETIHKWLKIFYKRFFAQQFKRSCLPDGPKVGSVAVSPRGDLRMPSDASSNAWIKEIG